MLKPFIPALALAVSLVPAPPAQAAADPTAPPGDWDVTGSATVASQYRFRGVSQSDNRPVVQATVTVTHVSGFYGAVWGSTAPAGASPVKIGGGEVDLSGGYAHALGQSGFTVDAGLFGYLYPGEGARNRYEIYAALARSLGPVTAKVGANLAPPQAVFDHGGVSATRHNLYLFGEVTSAIPTTPVTLHAHLGHGAGGLDLVRDTWDYNLGATAKWRRFAADLAIVGTTMSHGDVVQRLGPIEPEAFYRVGAPVAVVSLSVNF